MAEPQPLFRDPQEPPPADLEVEQALLAGILSNNATYDQVGDWLMPDHFADALHARIFEALRSEIEAGRKADARSLAAAMEAHDPQARRYLAELQFSVVSTDLRHYGRIVYDLAQRRELLALSADIEAEARALGEMEPAEEIVDRAAERLFALSELGGATRSGPRLLGEIAGARIAHHEAVHKGEIAPGMLTGLRDFDAALHGLHRKALIVVAGRASMGKTAFGLELAYRICSRTERLKGGEERPQPVLFFSLEMGAEELCDRLLGRLSGLGFDGLRDASALTGERIEKLIETKRRHMDALPLQIDDTAAVTVAQVHSRARRMKRRHGLSLIVVDYLQMMGARSARRGEQMNRTQQVGEISTGLKTVAKTLNVPVVALSQLNRAVDGREGNRPVLSDLRESGSIEQDADIVIFPFRQEYYLERSPPDQGSKTYAEWEQALAASRNVTDIIIAKNRHGPVRSVKVYSNMSTGAYADLDWMERRT